MSEEENAVPRALTTPPTPDRIGKDAVREALAGLVKWADNIMRAHSITSSQKAVERARRALSSTPAQTVIPEAADKTPRRDASPFPPAPAQPVDETERLRRALREIADDPYKHGQRVQKMKAIARDALQHKGEVSRG